MSTTATSTATRAAAAAAGLRREVAVRIAGLRRSDRGDVPGWVMVTLMTAGLVVALWAVAGPRLAQVFSTAMDRVLSGG